MATQSALYCASLPPTSHTSILSWEFFKTAIVTLQGVQAVNVYTGSFLGSVEVPTLALGTLFFPIAFLGLSRLFPAFWLTNEYAYVRRDDTNRADIQMLSLSSIDDSHHAGPFCIQQPRYRKRQQHLPA